MGSLFDVFNLCWKYLAQEGEVLVHQRLAGKARGETGGDIVAMDDDHQASVIDRDKFVQLPRGGSSMVNGVFPVQQFDGGNEGHRHRTDQKEQRSGQDSDESEYQHDENGDALEEA
ncbi:hypothetical protein ALQ93_200043 [Pseudomonas syringae pv. pisi]|nr:hypothetical protein ALQ93_200043 [Pseudomonas syringae pv. pisi]